MLSHAVYFTLRDPSAEATAKLVDSCKTHLSGHPGCLAFSVGTRAPQYDREVNDKEYHVAIDLIFDSHDSHDTYQKADRHTQFIAENAETWAKVRVCDTDLATFDRT
ncbi:MAG: Dabb family protein [Pirellulales bacterium]|jgi:hypothetical protein|nr:Dabb family protein [Pirellulales bacterium]